MVQFRSRQGQLQREAFRRAGSHESPDCRALGGVIKLFAGVFSKTTRRLQKARAGLCAGCPGQRLPLPAAATAAPFTTVAARRDSSGRRVIILRLRLSRSSSSGPRA